MVCIIKINTMLRFNRGFGLMGRFFGGAKPDASVARVVDLKENK